MKTLRRCCVWVLVGGLGLSGVGCCGQSYFYSAGNTWQTDWGSCNLGACQGEGALIAVGVLAIAYGIHAIVEACRGN
jgi:hypothetical protein